MKRVDLQLVLDGGDRPPRQRRQAAVDMAHLALPKAQRSCPPRMLLELTQPASMHDGSDARDSSAQDSSAQQRHLFQPDASERDGLRRTCNAMCTAGVCIGTPCP